MKKTGVVLGITNSLLLFVISCKHEIPGQTDTGGSNPTTTTNCSPDTTYFQQQALPVIISNCAVSGCHDNISHQNGVVLNSYSSIMSTGGVRPGNPGNSEFYKKITEHNNNDRMPPPPMNRLAQQQIDLIRTWIIQGAKNNSCVSSNCDTGNVIYSGAIRNIISNKCQGCHSGANPSGGFDFTNYNGVKARVDDGKLWGAVNHVQGFSPMPGTGSKLSDCELDQIKKWIDAGAPNN